jgi:hypothetical protein
MALTKQQFVTAVAGAFNAAVAALALWAPGIKIPADAKGYITGLATVAGSAVYGVYVKTSHDKDIAAIEAEVRKYEADAQKLVSSLKSNAPNQ